MTIPATTATSATSAKLRPRPHQVEAIDALTEQLNSADRAQLIAACGTGKTLIGRWLAERVDARTTLLLVPSLGLLAQTLTEWRRATGWRFEAFVCCSDPSTAVGAAERAADEGWDPGAPFWALHRAKVSTNPAVTGQFLAQTRPERPAVVFSTYHSLPVIEAAARDQRIKFDLGIFDEAHHLAGQPRALWRHALDDAHLRIDKRVSMTATPVNVETGNSRAALSMSDTAIFGRVAHRISFADAIANGLLVDYEVLVVDAKGLGKNGRIDPTAALAAAARHGARRILSFHGRVRKAVAFAAAADRLQLHDAQSVSAQVITGRTPARQRAARLDALADPPPNTIAVVSSARCLSEGIDVPAVDSVMFCDPKESTVDVIQAIGRALRTAPGKTRGLIVVPVVIDDAELDDDTALSTGAFAGVWRILRSLRSLDERLAADLDQHARTTSRRGTRTGTRNIQRVTFDLPSAVDLDRLVARIVDTSSGGWRTFYGHLLAYAELHGSVLELPQSYRPWAGGPLVGQWAERQRVAFRRGTLDPAKAALLAQVPGWAWDVQAVDWLRQCASIGAVAAGDGRLDLNGSMAGRPIRAHRGCGNGYVTVGRWCAAQRLAARRGELTTEQRAALQQIPGWSWNPTSERDAAMVDLLGEYVAWKHDANPPADFIDDDLPLGAWMVGIRRDRVLDRLAQPLLDEIEEVTAPAGTSGALRWRRTETLWRLGYDALRQYVTRTGTCRIPDQHIEMLDGQRINLSVWARRQRHVHRSGKLHPRLVAALEEIPGWLWEISLRDGYRAILSGVEHGTPTAYVKGCRCDDCTDANTARQAAREARAAAGELATDLVPAVRARGHLRILEGRGAPQASMSRAAGLNPKTIAEIITGQARRILPSTEQIILELTLEQVHAAAAPGTRIPAGPTWELLDELIDRGWPKAWIARELNMGRALQLRATQIRAVNAVKVAELHNRIGDRRPPPRRARQPLPTLEQILAAENNNQAEEVA